MQVMVVGGAGFIGLNLVEALLAAGHGAVLFDRAEPHPVAAEAFRALPGSFASVLGDVASQDALREAMLRHRVEGVFYGAALTSGARRERIEPDRVLAVNLLGLVNTLKAAAGRGVRRVVNISSGAAYGRSRDGGEPAPLVEEATRSEPETLYAVSKFASERAGRRLGELLRLDVRSVRLATIYGVWEIDTGARDTLSPFMQLALLARRGAPAVLARDGCQDWTYARDVAAALLVLMQAPAPAHDLYHVGCGRAWPITRWCEVLRARYPDFSYRIDADDANVELHTERDRAVMSNRRLAEDLGHDVPGDPAPALEDFAAWMAAHPAFWAP